MQVIRLIRIRRNNAPTVHVGANLRRDKTLKNPLAIILVVGGIALAIYGITLFGDSGESASVLGVDLSIQDNDMRMQSFMFMGIGLAALIGGLFVMKKK